MGLELDKAELANLQGVVSSTEAHLATASDTSRVMLSNLLQNAQNRLSALEKKLSEAEKEQAHEKESATMAVLERQKLVAEETALNGNEKEAYGQFLAKEFFTKKDFGKLDRFYAHSWERLSEGGKEQMSQRVWEGIRQHEFTFADMPEVMQKDESGQLYRKFTGKENPSAGMENIPAQDKADFIREYEAGDKKAVAKVLDRQGFAENLSSRVAVSRGDTAISKDNKIEEKIASVKPEQQKESNKNVVDADLSAEFSDHQAASVNSVSPTALNRNSSSSSLSR